MKRKASSAGSQAPDSVVSSTEMDERYLNSNRDRHKHQFVEDKPFILPVLNIR